MAGPLTASDNLTPQWARLGALFNVIPAPRSPDLERLLLDTVRQVPDNSRLFSMAATWLSQYATYVARHRLLHMVRAELEPDWRPHMGLLLETVADWSGFKLFASIVAACEPAERPQPLFSVQRQNQALWKLSQRHASELSKKWNLWMPPFEPKLDALRPPEWVLAMNPTLRDRADFRGDLRASIVEELRRNPSAGQSESALARACVATRVAVRHSLAQLQLTGRIVRQLQQNRVTVALTHPHATLMS